MIEKIVKHFQEMLPVWIVGIVISGFGVAISGAIAWNNLQRDLNLIKCRIGVDVEAADCAYVRPITKDIEDAVASGSEEVPE